MAHRRRARESGQAAVESVLTLPLTTFLILGTIQLFMLLQAKVMAQYAVFQAARVGSTTHGRCDAMMHAAILSLIPTFHNYMSASSAEAGSPGVRLGQAFSQWNNNDYGGTGAISGPYRAGWNGDAIIWLARDRPDFVGPPTDNWQTAQKYFDVPIDPATGGLPIHIELKLVYWAPLQIPFADWVFSRLALASLGLLSYTGGNPLMPVQNNAGWTTGAMSGAVTGTQAPIAGELMARVAAKHYVYPIVTTYSMRMMSPVKLSEYPPFGGSQNCPGTPVGLK
jgi:hypothetical protein